MPARPPAALSAEAWPLGGPWIGARGGASPRELLPWLRTLLPLDWLLRFPCACCRGDLRPEEHSRGLCSPCLQRLALPTGGLQGSQPLPWWSCGSYRGALRSQLLGLRRRPDSALLQALLPALLPPIAALEGEPWLVPVPSWKRRANPLPELLVQALSQRSKARGQGLLRRSRPVLGQHHLNRTLRELNQIGSFQALRPAGAGESRRHPLLVVDDILTTGATAFHAAACLEAAGWRVVGLLCLARTPAGGGR